MLPTTADDILLTKTLALAEFSSKVFSIKGVTMLETQAGLHLVMSLLPGVMFEVPPSLCNYLLCIMPDSRAGFPGLKDNMWHQSDLTLALRGCSHLATLS